MSILIFYGVMIVDIYGIVEIYDVYPDCMMPISLVESTPKISYLSSHIIFAMESTLIFCLPNNFDFTISTIRPFNFDVDHSATFFNDVTWFVERKDTRIWKIEFMIYSVNGNTHLLRE